MTSLGLLHRTSRGVVPALDRIAYHAVAGALGQELEGRIVELLSAVRSRPEFPETAPQGRASTPRGTVHDEWGTPSTVSNAIAHARREVLIALPGSYFPREVLQNLTGVIRAALGRNAGVEIICQHPTRFNEPVKHFVREVGAAGGQVRTLEEFFKQLVVVDRTVAFVSMLDPGAKGAVIQDPVVVAFLVDLYERHWTRAVDHPFQPTHAARAVGEVGLALREALVRMLVNGHPDKQIAKRLGLSLRSTAEHVARLKSELGAKNRTEMGYLLAKREHDDGPMAHAARGTGAVLSA
ncbi:LuxR C-terminal-related transcriptional regulator [Streptomyces sp. NPDC002088]|uniref:helix-turn-helix transcriptional regulator n=1 Tax=Streptomyces sp. NPDC002088 TaxID=3154665 RepID=UPI0033166BC6